MSKVWKFENFIQFCANSLFFKPLSTTIFGFRFWAIVTSEKPNQKKKNYLKYWNIGLPLNGRAKTKKKRSPITIFCGFQSSLNLIIISTRKQRIYQIMPLIRAKQIAECRENWPTTNLSKLSYHINNWKKKERKFVKFIIFFQH